MKAKYIGLALVISVPCLSQDTSELRKLENVAGTVRGTELTARVAFVQCFQDKVMCFGSYTNEEGARMYSEFDCPDIKCFDSRQDITYEEFKQHRETHREYRPSMAPDKKME